jgi:PAS domain S-box-containing protein
MKDQSLRVLMVEDSEDDALLTIRVLKKGGYNPVYERVETAAAMKKALKDKQWDIILCNHQMPKFSGPSAIALLKESNIGIPLIIVTGNDGEETAVECMRLGAQDYIMKGNLSRLCPAIARELEDTKVRNKQKLAEDALHQSKEKYRTILEEIQEGYFEVDLSGNFTFFNNSLFRYFGYSKEELMGMNYRQYTDKEHSKELFQAYNKVYNTGEPTEGFDWQIIRKDGTKRYVEASISLRKDSSGKSIGFRGIARDVTEHKKVEEALKKSAEQYRLLADNMTAHIWLMDYNSSKTIYVSPSVEKMYGYTSDEIINLSLKKFLTAESFQKIIDSFSIEIPKALAKPLPYVHKFLLELEAYHKDGRLLWIENDLSIMRDENGKLAFLLGETRDITKRKKAEEALRESEEKYKSLIDNVPDIIFTIDLEGKITFISKRAKEISGYENAEIINRNIFDFIPEEAHQSTMEKLQKGMKGEKIKHVEMPITVKSGEKLFFDFSFTRIYKNGAVVGAQGTAVNITERKRAEEELKQSEEKYRLLADHMKDQVWLMDLDLNMTYISPSVEKLLGYTFNEFKHLPLDKILSATSYQAAMEFVSIEMPKALAAPPDYILNRTLELEVCCKDGHSVWEESKFTLVRDDNGKPLSILGEARDITERKLMEEKLRNDQKELHAIMDASPIGVSWSDMQGNIKYTNQKFQEIFGYTVEELPNIDAWLLLAYPSPAYKEHVLSLVILYIEAQMQGKENNPIELTVVCKNGSIRHVLQTMLFTPNRILAIYYDITERKLAEEKLQQTLESLRKAVGTTIQVLVSAVESRDAYTSGHQARSSNLACAIAMEMGLAQEKIEGIRMAGIIHDIGKLSIPAEILSKPSKLTEIEFSLIKQHSQSGYEMLKDVESPWPLAQIVYQHHERMNGSGYPRNLKGDEIIMEARILAVTDVVEAMASHRPYRPTLGIEAALEEIEKNKGILYDDVVTDACLKLFREKGYQLT